MCVSGSQVAVNEEALDWRASTELKDTHRSCRVEMESGW